MLAGSLLAEEPPEVINFASLEGRGIDLNDPSLELADEGEVDCYVSAAVTGAAGTFGSPVKIVIATREGYGSAPGLTLRFFKDYCPAVKITAYNGQEVTAQGEFEPIALDYFCDLTILKFTRIEIEIKKTQAPRQLVKLKSVNLGRQTEISDFFGNIEIFNEIAVDCNDLPGGTCDFEADFGGVKPAEGQRLRVEHDGSLYGVYTVETTTATGGGVYAVEAIDDAFVLDEIPLGQSVSGSLTVADFIARLKGAGVTVESDIDDSTAMTGSVEADGKTTLRQLAAMVSFATGANLSAAGAERLRLKKATETGATIGADRIIGKASYTAKPDYAQVVVTAGDATATVVNPDKRSGRAATSLTFDKSKLIISAADTAAEIAARGWSRCEIAATIIVSGERVGDIVSIDVPGQGLRRGVIKSMAYHLRRRSVTADIVMVELPDGGDD